MREKGRKKKRKKEGEKGKKEGWERKIASLPVSVNFLSQYLLAKNYKEQRLLLPSDLNLKLTICYFPNILHVFLIVLFVRIILIIISYSSVILSSTFIFSQNTLQFPCTTLYFLKVLYFPVCYTHVYCAPSLSLQNYYSKRTYFLEYQSPQHLLQTLNGKCSVFLSVYSLK